MGIVLWKPLYVMSIAMFILSVVLFPVSSKWSILTVFALVTLWSRIPGFVHFTMNKLALNDLFSFIITMNLGGFAGGFFGAFSMLFSRIVGPEEWWPFTVRYSAAIFFAGIISPFIIRMAGVEGIGAYFWFEGTLYVIYYILVVLFAKEEIGLEIALLPAVFFFDFVMNAAVVRIFGGTIDNMLAHGLSSGWPVIIFAGLVLGFLALAKNGKKVAAAVEPFWNKVFVWKKLPNMKKKEQTHHSYEHASEVPNSLAPHVPEKKEPIKEEKKADVVEQKVEKFESEKKKKRPGFFSSMVGKIGSN